MNTHEGQITMPVRTTAANSRGTARAKAVALEAARALSRSARDALLAYAMTGSAVASIVVVAAPHFEVLLRCIFHGRG
ncbi:hypothetical protein V1283_002139 [Bradyrhizobium sp. AZCC 2262]|uniref:hypothetical protein n=1 Tax=Bradyrhizobium sp. AZCC 2262 TaxID=3117022 RepID=UPI002FEE6890